MDHPGLSDCAARTRSLPLAVLTRQSHDSGRSFQLFPSVTHPHFISAEWTSDSTRRKVKMNRDQLTPFAALLESSRSSETQQLKFLKRQGCTFAYQGTAIPIPSW